MLFRDPGFLWLLVAVGGVVALVAASSRWRAARLRAFADEHLVKRLAPHVDGRRRALRTGLRVLALGLLVVALAGPKWGFRWEEVHRQGIDLIVALDTSRSMLATDVKPNRLERAKLAVLDMVQLLQGDRVGLVAFAGTAFLECPLTLDYAAFERSLRATKVGIIPRGGTALARAIDVSLAGFEARQGKHNGLILITDGEDHEGDIEEAAKRAAERGVKIYAVGIGTAEGELIPATTEGGGSFVKDRQGQVVKSRLNEKTLEQVALTSGGAYVRGLGAALGLDEVFRDHIAKMERREVASTLERRYEERFQLPLVLALLCLLVEALIGERRRERMRAAAWLRLRRRRPSATATGGPVGRPPQARSAAGRATLPPLAVVLLCLLVPALGGWLDPPGDRAAEGNHLYERGKYAEAAAKFGEGLVDEPGSPLLRFNLATALYKQGKFADASAEWSKLMAAGDPAWAGRASYNLGNAQYRLGANAETEDPQAAVASYEQALFAYKRAMSESPADPDPKFNHEVVARKLAALKKRLEEEKQKQEEQEKEQQQQEEQEQQDKQQQPEEQQQQEGEPQRQQQQEQQAQQEQEEQQAASSEKQPQEEQEPQQQAGQQQEEQAESPAGARQEREGERSPDQRAAQAILDTARNEEMSPEEVQRLPGVAVPGEPAQDW